SDLGAKIWKQGDSILAMRGWQVYKKQKTQQQQSIRGYKICFTKIHETVHGCGVSDLPETKLSCGSSSGPVTRRRREEPGAPRFSGGAGEKENCAAGPGPSVAF